MKHGLPVIVLLLGSAAPAFAMDCARAEPPVEKAICADAHLMAVDQQIGQAYEALRRTRNDAAKTALQGSQMAWLAERDRCADQKNVNACLGASMNDRLFYLAGRAKAGPGAASRIVPLIRWRDTAGKPTLGIEALSFAAPRSLGERLFNGRIAKKVGVAMTGADEPDYRAGMSATLVYASAHFVSAHLYYFYNNSDSAHPYQSHHDVNIDLARGRELTFADLFGGVAAHKIVSLCRRQVLAEKIKRDKKPEEKADLARFDSALETGVRDLRSWSFGVDRVVVTFNLYVLGAYSEGSHDCELPYSDLRPLAKPGAWPVD